MRLLSFNAFQSLPPEQLAGAWALFDVDLFQSFNDTFGFGRGDEVLDLVGGWIGRHLLRPVYRVGGDEFAVPFGEMPLKQVVLLTRQTQNGMADLNVPYSHATVRSPHFDYVSLSAAVVVAQSGQAARALLDSLQSALYEGRRRRRPQSFWTPPHRSN